MHPKKFALKYARYNLFYFLIFLSLIYIVTIILFFKKAGELNNQVAQLSVQKVSISSQLAKTKSELDDLKNQDQYKINKDLQSKITSIEKTYNLAVSAYEKLLDLKTISNKTDKYDNEYADSLTLLSERKYSSAEATLNSLISGIQQERDKIVSSFSIPNNIPSSNTPPSSGYSSQTVHTDLGDFWVDIISADLNSTRVIVDTATDGDCGNNCPVLSLGDYVSRNGAFAGVNGSYFCPASYPSCAGKTNSYDTLVMNKNKKYINSGNNVYSTVPAAIFFGNQARFVAQSLEWGRDTGIDAVIANRPLLVFNGQNVFGGTDQAKELSRGSRSFVGNNGNTVYIGVVFNATVAEAAKTLSTLGLQNALNLDDGGSTALWFGGYKAGPGRDLPNVVLFVKK